ncbi:MAG: DUF5134 domain-containing protein [Pseudonocardia sp.]|nr:DUF5134 domain-containing protein [Pseudonocardia sp.]
MVPGGSWSGVPLAVACALAGLFFVRQLATGREGLVPAAAHVVMAAGMTAMFVPALDPIPVPVWASLFLLIGAWFGAVAIRTGSLLGEPGHHVVGATAMLFMLVGATGHTHAAPAVSTAGGGEHAQHAAAAAASGGGLTTTAIALALAAWFLADLVRRPARAQRPVGPASPGAVPAGVQMAARPRVAVGARAPHLVMSGAMTVMLLGMA